MIRLSSNWRRTVLFARLIWLFALLLSFAFVEGDGVVATLSFLTLSGLYWIIIFGLGLAFPNPHALISLIVLISPFGLLAAAIYGTYRFHN